MSFTSSGKTGKARRRLSGWGALAVLAIALASMGQDCDGDVLNDPTLADWCGNTLCDWTVDAGNIARVPTWDSSDLGVSFVETPTQISQLSAEDSATCLLFTTVANVDPAAQMQFELDINNDGTIDYMFPIVGSWQRVQSEITMPASYHGINFILEKSGTGTAVLAEIRVQSTTGCTGTVVPLAKLALGDPCTSGEQCASGICPATFMVCSECSLDGTNPCPPGQSCGARPYTLAGQCSPGKGLGATGTGCFGNDDCASGMCVGAVVTPAGDAGPDASPCNLDVVDAGSLFNPTTCANTWVSGGTCN